MNTLKTLAFVATATIVAAQAGGAGDAPVMPRPKDDGVQTAAFDKKEAVVQALTTCFKAQKAATLAAAKTACKIDTEVTKAITAWGKTGTAADLVDRLTKNEPQLRDIIGNEFAVNVATASDADIEGLIGVAAGASLADKAAGVKDYRQKDGADKFADAVKTCKETGTKTTAQKKACATGSAVIADLCTKTKNTLECCNGNGASNCDAKDALKVLEGAADEKLSKATKACSRGLVANVAACTTAAETAFKETTGVDLTDEAGKILREEKLANAATGAVGDAVKGCMGSIATGLDAAAAKAYRQGCVGGDDAIQAMADALGKGIGDISKTDAAKFAHEGAKTAGRDKMKTFTGTGTDAEKLAQKLGAARTDMAAAAGKKSGTLFIFLVVFFFYLVIMF